MPAGTQKSQSSVEKMRGVQVNPILVIVVAILIVGGLGYWFWLRPEMEAAKTKANWSSPEAAAARSPEGRPKDTAHEQFLKDLRAKRGGGGTGQGSASRRDTE